MQNQMEAVKQVLFSVDALNVSNIKLFPGSSRDATAEEMAVVIGKVIDQMLVGDFEEGELVFAD